MASHKKSTPIYNNNLRYDRFFYGLCLQSYKCWLIKYTRRGDTIFHFIKNQIYYFILAMQLLQPSIYDIHTSPIVLIG